MAANVDFGGFPEEQAVVASKKVCQLLQRAVAGGFRIGPNVRGILVGMRPPNVNFQRNTVLEARTARSKQERASMRFMSPLHEQDSHNPPACSSAGHSSYVQDTGVGEQHAASGVAGGWRAGGKTWQAVSRTRSLSPYEGHGYADPHQNGWGESPSHFDELSSMNRGAMSVTPTHPWRRPITYGGGTLEHSPLPGENDLSSEFVGSEAHGSHTKVTPREWASRMLLGRHGKKGNSSHSPEATWCPVSGPELQHRSQSVRGGAFRPPVPSSPVSDYIYSREVTIEEYASENPSPTAARRPSHPVSRRQPPPELRIPEGLAEPEPEVALKDRLLFEASSPLAAGAIDSFVPGANCSPHADASGRLDDVFHDFSGNGTAEGAKSSRSSQQGAVSNIDEDQIALVGSRNLKAGGMAHCLRREEGRRQQREELFGCVSEDPWGKLGPTFAKPGSQKPGAQSGFRGRPSSASKRQGVTGVKEVHQGNELQVMGVRSPLPTDSETPDPFQDELRLGMSGPSRGPLTAVSPSLLSTKSSDAHDEMPSSSMKRSMGAKPKIPKGNFKSSPSKPAGGPAVPKDLRKFTQSISPPPVLPPSPVWPPQGLAPKVKTSGGPPKGPPAVLSEASMQTGEERRRPSDASSTEGLMVQEALLSGRKVIQQRCREDQLDWTNWAQIPRERSTPEEILQMEYKMAVQHHFPGGLTAIASRC